MWQQLVDSLPAEEFTVIAVAEDSGGIDAVRPWIEAANPSYPALIDVEHRVAALYGMVNVPQAVWIDEAGHIVRPPETAGSADTLRQMDPVTKRLPPEAMALRQKTKADYMDAVRDWVRTGRHALPGDAARARLPEITPEIARAHAEFRLGIWLRRHGREDEAAVHLAEASRLHPDSWNMYRQAAPKDGTGLASGAAFFARVMASGKAYYEQAEF